jgi:arylsulfatase A-like enzyme
MWRRAPRTLPITPPRLEREVQRSVRYGWDAYREQTLERQKKLGVVPKDTKLTTRSRGLPAWDSLNADQKRLYARMMEVFAGYGAQVDHEMGASSTREGAS